jgi:upstream activation factor subunit UAF30
MNFDSHGKGVNLATKKTTKKAKAPAKKATKKAAAPKKATAKKATKKAAAPKKAKAKRKPNAAFMAPLSPSETLASIIGNKPVPRTEAVKRLWEYIKKNGLQDKKNKRMINADERLHKLFGAAQVSMFEIAKSLKKHLK